METNRANIVIMKGACVIQGSLAIVANTGVLITGKPGVGKSLAMLELGLKGHGVVCDELVRLHRPCNEILVGEPVDRVPMIEVRGLGVFRLQDLMPEVLQQSSEIELVVELAGFEQDRDLGRIAPEMDQFELLGGTVPRYRVPLASGVSPGLLIEILVRFQRHSSKEQSER